MNSRELICPLCNSKGVSAKFSLEFTIYPCNTRLYNFRQIRLQSRECHRIQNGITTPPMKFQIAHMFSKNDPEIFTELNPPIWLSSENSIPGSTMDGRWFWEEHVLTLKVGESIDTDFSIITRLE